VIVHVDRWGNLISNLAGPARGVAIAGHELVLATTYVDVAPGALVAYRGSAGTIEVAVRDGSAAERLGLARGCGDRGGAMTEVAIHALAAGGDGVGRDPDGRAVFVAAAAPGDVLEVELVERHERWARGELVAIVTPGPGRIAPRCPLFAARTCGGCDWAHLDQPTQRAAKHAVVAGATRRLIAAGARLEPLACPEPDWGWRRRARLAITATAIGLRGRGATTSPTSPLVRSSRPR
jgi:predicted RNA-binding protein with TRAM domain